MEDRFTILGKRIKRLLLPISVHYEMCRKIEELIDKENRRMVLTYTSPFENDVLHILLVLLSRLKGDNKKFLADFRDGYLLQNQSNVMLVHNPEKFGDFSPFLSPYGVNTLVFSTEYPGVWSPESSDFMVYNISPDSSDIQRAKKYIEESMGFLKGIDMYRFKLIALSQYFGSSIPLDVFMRITKMPEEEVNQWFAGTPDIISVCLRKEPRSTLVLFENAGIAEEIFKKMKVREIGKLATVIVSHTNLLSSADRLFVQRLLYGMGDKGYLMLSRKILKDIFGKVVEIVESIPEILAWARTFYRNFLFEEADKLFSKGIEAEPENIYLLHAYAKMLIEWSGGVEQRLLKKAEQFLERSLLKEDNVYSLVTLAEISKGKRAEYLFHKAEARTPNNPVIYVSRADRKLKHCDFVSAIREIERALENEPENPYALHLKGVLLMRTGKFREAIEIFKKIRMADRFCIHAIHSMGVLALKRGHWKKAERFFNEVLRVSPDSLFALHSKGVLFAERGEFQKAERLFKRVLSIHPYHLESAVELANVFLKEGNPDKAINLLSSYQNVDNAYVYVTLARAYILKKDFVHARKLAEKARAFSRSPAVFLLFANIEEKERKEGWKEIAIRWFKTAEEVAEERGDIFDFIITLNTRAKFELNNGNLDKAVEYIERSLKLDEENSYTRTLYADILEEKDPSLAEEQRNLARRLREER